MLNLIKTDLKRIFKDKLFLVACILGVAFALFTPLLYRFLIGSLVELDGGETLSQQLGLYGKTLFFSAFSPSNNLGLIVPVLLGIVLCKDFSFGTVRNKIIGGKSRTSIFLSMFVSCTAMLWIILFLHAALTLAVSMLFFEYQPTAFELKDLGYLFASLGLDFLVYVFIAALLCFLCVFMKNAGVTVVMFVAINFLFSIVGSIVSVARIFVDPAKEFLTAVLKFLDQANIFMGTYIGLTDAYDWKGILPVLVGTIGGTALFLFLGTVTFRKKDLK